MRTFINNLDRYDGLAVLMVLTVVGLHIGMIIAVMTTI